MGESSNDHVFITPYEATYLIKSTKLAPEPVKASKKDLNKRFEIPDEISQMTRSTKCTAVSSTVDNFESDYLYDTEAHNIPAVNAELM